MIQMVSRLRARFDPAVHLPAIGLLGYLVWVLIGGGSTPLEFAGSLGAAAIRAAAAWLFFAAVGSAPAQRPRRSWRYIGVGIGLWAAAAALTGLLRAASGTAPPLPSLPDLLTLAGSLAILTGVVNYRHPERFGRLREVLEVAILVLAVSALTWLVLLRTALMVELADPIRTLWSGVMPALDLVAAGLVARDLLRAESKREATTMGLFVAAALVSALADLGDGYRRLQGPALSSGSVEAAWMLAGLLFVLTARWAARESTGHAAPPRLAARLEALLPIALTYLVVGSALVDWWSTGRPDWFVIGSSGVLSLLLMARQGLIAGQIEMRQYAALVNASADLSFVCDADGVILLANPAFASAVGETPQRLIGTNLKSYFTDEQFEPNLEDALQHGWSGEARLMSGRVPLYLSLRPVRDERRTRPLLAGAGLDLRAVKQRENELEAALAEVASARGELERLNSDLEFKVEERTAKLAETVADLARVNEELKELDRMKTEFVALVSHELRSPLTNIRSGLEVVLDRNPKLQENVEESLSLVHRETKRLSGLVETIMDLSALEAGRFPLHPQPLELDAMTKEVVAQFPSLNRLKLSFAEELPQVNADPEGLKSVLYHLLDNACKYAPEGELILEAEPENGSVLISLTDSGPGIPESERERVFEMFHRLDSRDAREVYGHGLGLPMAKRLIEAMGGEIRVDAAEQRGARFVIRLPRAGRSEVAQRAESTSAGHKSSRSTGAKEP